MLFLRTYIPKLNSVKGISEDSEQYACDSHNHIFHQFKKIFESGILFSGLSTVQEDTDSCDKQSRCALDIYLNTVLSYSYDIIMDRLIILSWNRKNVVDGLNVTGNSI